MNNTNNIINSQTLFDVSKLAAVAQALKQHNSGFFNTSNREQKVQEYFDLLNEYALVSKISQKMLETTFKNVTGVEYSAMKDKHNISLEIVAPAA